MHTRTHYRSLFWPVILIGVGVIWLLSNLGFANTANLYQLWRLWPVLLIAAGIDLLFARRIPFVGAILGVAIVALVGFFLLGNYQLPGASVPVVTTDHLQVPKGTIHSAKLTMDFWSDPVKISALMDPAQAFDATVVHTGEIDFNASGDAEKSIQLRRRDTIDIIYPWFLGQDLHADVGLSPQVLYDITIHSGSGSSDFNLSNLQLKSFSLDSGSGSIHLVLPKSTQAYTAKVNSGSGSIDAAIETDTALELRLSSGSGSVNLSVPSGSAVQLDVQDRGSGSVNLPADFTQTSKTGDKTGTWETAGYQNAQNKIHIIVEGIGSGSLNLHH